MSCRIKPLTLATVPLMVMLLEMMAVPFNVVFPPGITVALRPKRRLISTNYARRGE